MTQRLGILHLLSVGIHDHVPCAILTLPCDLCWQTNAVGTRQGLCIMQQGTLYSPSSSCALPQTATFHSTFQCVDMATQSLQTSLSRPLLKAAQEHADNKRSGRAVLDNLTEISPAQLITERKQCQGRKLEANNLKHGAAEQAINSIGLSPTPRSTLPRTPPWPPAPMRAGSWTAPGNYS